MTKLAPKFIPLILIVVAVVVSIALMSFTNSAVNAATACQTDINQDGIVDLSDYGILSQNFFKTPISNPRADINGDGIVDLSDYSLLAGTFFAPCTPSSSSSSTSSATSSLPANTTEWTQFGANPQRTGYTPDIPALSWKYMWQWNGADVTGQPQPITHKSVPDLVQPIIGGGRIYMVAENSLYALNPTSGTILWQRVMSTTLNATPAYLNEYIYLPASDGKVYKINATTGIIDSSFAGSGAFNTAVLLVGNTVYAGTDQGQFYAINTANMSKIWQYSLGSPLAGPASYSASRNIVIANAQDLNVHAINAGTGTLKWKVKPTPRTYGGTGNLISTTARFEDGWPVVAEKAGIVFVRYELDWDTLWKWNPFPDNNAQIQANLSANPDQQALFALSLDTGSKAFIPAAGNGGQGDGGDLPMGPQPVIKEYNGKEVAYIIWRNKQTCAAGWCDGREDATMGEMVLDNNTVSGYSAGQVRFVKWIDIQTDEMMYLTMGGNVLFNGHWLVNSAEVIDPNNRGSNVGATYTNPIPVKDAPFVIWRQCYCPSSNPSCNPVTYPGHTPGQTSTCPINCAFSASRYCPGGLGSYGDTRGYSQAGFFEYHMSENRGSTPFTIPTKNLVLVKTLDGAIMAFGTGNPTADAGNVQANAAQVAGVVAPPKGVIDHSEAGKYVSSVVTARGKVASVVNHLPKAVYIGFKNPHDGDLLIRVFQKDLSKFTYDLSTLNGKTIEVTGLVTLYWPDNIDPEIIVTDPAQIKILN
jgi:hypothetical protein